MTSEVHIANLALSHLGDSATVSSLDPPEGSVQAEHCAHFYPIARDTLLELHPWAFATRRALLAELTPTWPQWRHAYAPPDGCLRLLAILPPDALDDLTSMGGRIINPQPFTVELDAAGNKVVLTNQPQALARYTERVTDPTRFTPLFVLTQSWHLASMLAGPVIKGEPGRAEAKRCAQMAEYWLGRATQSDAQTTRDAPEHAVPWLANR